MTDSELVLERSRAPLRCSWCAVFIEGGAPWVRGVESAEASRAQHPACYRRAEAHRAVLRLTEAVELLAGRL